MWRTWANKQMVKRNVKAMAVLRLILVAETTAARLYRNGGGGQQWIPRSQCKSTTKYPPVEGQPNVHDVDVNDWFLKRSPFPPNRQPELL